MEQPDASLLENVRKLERENRRMMLAICILIVLWVSVVALVLLRPANAVFAAPASEDGILRARGIVITDANGVERVWIGAPLPNPPLFGRRYKRSVDVSGVLVLDQDGTERGGYVTDSRGSVFLSLDSVGSEVGDFTAQAGGGVTLTMLDGESELGLQTDVTGPGMKLTHKEKVIYQAPSAEADKKQ